MDLILMRKARELFRKVTESLGLRRFIIKFIVYNKYFMKILSLVNDIRWKKIDLVMIVWPPAIPYIEEIRETIENQYEVLSFEIIEMQQERFGEFIHRLYDIDFANPRKVALKIDRLVRPPSTLGVLLVRFPKPEMVVQDVFNTVRCDTVGDLKDCIRKKISPKINNYIYDVVIHSAEADYQNKDIRDLLKEYKLK